MDKIEKLKAASDLADVERQGLEEDLAKVRETFDSPIELTRPRWSKTLNSSDPWRRTMKS